MVWREIKSRRQGSSLSELRRQKESLEAREEKARELLEEVQEQVKLQSKDISDREER